MHALVRDQETEKLERKEKGCGSGPAGMQRIVTGEEPHPGFVETLMTSAAASDAMSPRAQAGVLSTQFVGAAAKH